jgi:hypothetical protein
MKLKEQLWPVVKEYTRQVVELMEASEWHWIGTDDNGKGEFEMLDLDGEWFLSFGNVQIIIDRMDEWVKRYGSREAVAQEIRDWQNWWLEAIDTTDGLLELWESRRQRGLRTYPHINLEHWLMGCPREGSKRDDPDDELRVLLVQRKMLTDLCKKYRDARTLSNVIDNLSAEIKEKQKQKDARDAKLMEEIKQRESLQEFLKKCEKIDKERGKS